MRRIIFLILFIFSITVCAQANNNMSAPILVYHNFDPIKKGSMTISTARFAEQMQWLVNHHYTFIPLTELVNYLRRKINTLPPQSIVITDDDGRASVYQYMLPIAEKYHIPVTLFIYPLIISKAHYALTWEQLKKLQQTRLFTVEDHTYWHPNFKQERRRLSDAAYEKLVQAQLVTSKMMLEKKLGTPVTLLAWPFGIHNTYLENQAKKAGYVMAFSIGARKAKRSDPFMAMPRYMVIQDQNMATFERMVE